MSDDPLRDRLLERIGLPLSGSGTSEAPEPVNEVMIHHWVDALDDRNPIYEDGEAAAATRHGGIVAPPAMLQTWTFARPKIKGIAERGGAAREMSSDSPLSILADAGYRGTLATNSGLDFARYLRPGDHLHTATVLDSISEQKATGLGAGYFVTWVTTYTVRDEVVGRQSFRVLKFDPSTMGQPRGSGGGAKKPAAEPPTGEKLPDWGLDVTPTVVVAGAIASRDFMPAHHDPEFARAQGASDIFFNILTSNGYVSRYLTDWAGPEAILRSISIRLGASAVPGLPLRFSGQVSTDDVDGDERVLEVAVRAANDLGDHVTGTVVLTLPV